MAFAGYVLAKQITVPAGTTISVTNNGGGPSTVTITAGEYTLVTLCAMIQTNLTAQRAPSAGAWSVSLSLTTGQIAIAMSSGTFSITWTSTDLRDLLGFTANIVTQTSSTGPSQAKGIWIPDCTLVADVDLKRAPLATGRRVSIAPNGRTSSAAGTPSYLHKGLLWSHVVHNRVWRGEETLANASYETFIKDVVLRLGHSWFPYDGKVIIVDHRSVTVGQDASITGWQVATLPELHTLEMSEDRYVGYIAISWPLITADA